MAWLRLIITEVRENADFISDFLFERDALSVTLEDAGVEPLFQEGLNETPLWKNTQIHALFAEHAPVSAVMDELSAALSKPLDYQIEHVEDQDWVQVTQQNFPAQLFANRLWILPSWQSPDALTSGVILRINPGLGFGTGTHPTTSLCLNWLAQQDLTNKTVIDYGCGSGILGLAALALGAKQVWAVDHDPQALIATQNNAELNHFPDAALNIVLPEQFPNVQADIILANILANPLCELASQLTRHLAPHGQLVLSGFLVEETERVARAYQPALQTIDAATQDNWVRLVLGDLNQTE